MMPLEFERLRVRDQEKKNRDLLSFRSFVVFNAVLPFECEDQS
jgi:hypothetical protein